MAGNPADSDEDLPPDLGDGERHCRGEMAPFVRIFLRLPPADAGLGISSIDPLKEPSLELANDLDMNNMGGCSLSVPLPSDCPRYTTVSQENSDDEAFVEVPEVVRSELDFPDPDPLLRLPLILLLSSDELLFSLFLRSRCSLDANWTVWRVSE